MTVGSKDCYTGYNATILAFLGNPRGRSPLVEPPTPRTVSPQAKPYSRYAFAPSPQRGHVRCRLQIGEGPALHSSQQVMLAARNSAPLRFRYTSLDSRSRNLKAKPQALN